MKEAVEREKQAQRDLDTLRETLMLREQRLDNMKSELEVMATGREEAEKRFANLLCMRRFRDGGAVKLSASSSLGTETGREAQQSQ